MEEAFELGGLALAHALWSIADGEELVPFVLWEDAARSRSVVRFSAEVLAQAVEEAHAWLDAPPAGCARAAFACDAAATVGDEPMDAIVLRVVAIGEGSAEVVLAYRATPGGLEAQSPRIGLVAGLDPSALGRFAEALARGIATHPEGQAALGAALRRPG